MWQLAYLIHLLALHHVMPFYLVWFLPVCITELLWRKVYRRSRQESISIYISKSLLILAAPLLHIWLVTNLLDPTRNSDPKASLEWGFAAVIGLLQVIIMLLIGTFVEVRESTQSRPI